MRAFLLRITTAAERLRIWLVHQQWFSSKLLPAMPRRLRWALRTIYLKPVDLADRLRGPNHPVVPPRAHNYSGPSMATDWGNWSEAVDTLRDLAGLTPSSRVLDVGCGMGRLAAAMSSFFDATGSYDGLDIVPDGIKWCKENIVGRHDNVHFTLSDVRNGEYNPQGKIEAVDYRFPFDDELFDLVVLVSVFTHMLPDDLEHYLEEIARILKPTGSCFATYYLLTEESRELMLTKNSRKCFKHHFGSYSVMSAKVPELGVAYDVQFIEQLYAQHGLTSERYLGWWFRGQPSRWSPLPGEQDALVARKRAAGFE